MACNEFFSAIPVSKFPPPLGGEVLTVKTTDTLLEATRFLDKHNILSAPVVDPAVPEDAPWKERYKGILDLMAVIDMMLTTLKPSQEEHPGVGDDRLFFKHLMKEHLFASLTVGDALAQGHSSARFVPVPDDANLLDCVLMLGKYHAHRLPVVDAKGKLVNYITQSAIIRLVHEHAAELPEVMGQTINSLGLGAPLGVAMIRLNRPTSEAFNLIKSLSISAVAVEGEFGQLVGTVSVRDVRAIVGDNRLFRLLHSPIRQFLQEARDGQADAASPAICCKGVDSLLFVIGQMCTSRIHRIFLLDGENVTASRVISLSDILSHITREPKGWVNRLMS